jgi:FtsH-binding integral membrane protein
MQKWIRRIRGAIGMGLTWAVAWGVAGMVPRWLFGFNPDAPFPIIFGVIGFVAGVTFSGVLMLLERRREFDQMTLPRFAGWGGLSGLLVSAVFARVASLGASDVMVIAPVFVVACAACASGSLALAKRAKMRELPDGSTGEIELSAREKRKLYSRGG